jgi:hypothetical protein
MRSSLTNPWNRSWNDGVMRGLTEQRREENSALLSGCQRIGEFSHRALRCL